MFEILNNFWNVFRVVRVVQVSLFWLLLQSFFSFGSEKVPFELIYFLKLMFSFILVLSYIFICFYIYIYV